MFVGVGVGSDRAAAAGLCRPPARPPSPAFPERSSPLKGFNNGYKSGNNDDNVLKGQAENAVFFPCFYKQLEVWGLSPPSKDQRVGTDAPTKSCVEAGVQWRGAEMGLARPCPLLVDVVTRDMERKCEKVDASWEITAKSRWVFD